MSTSNQNQSRYVPIYDPFEAIVPTHILCSQSQSTPHRPEPQNSSEMAVKSRPGDLDSLYAPSTTSTKVSSSSIFGSFSKLPLLPRSRPSTSSSTSSSNSGSTLSPSQVRKDSLSRRLFQRSRDHEKGKDEQNKSDHSQPTASVESQKTEIKPRDPVKTIPNGKPPAVNFADLAYRYGAPGTPSQRRL
jgi:hypothetical protein